MIAVFAAARAAVSRRRLQTLIVAMVVLLSAATGVLAIGLLVVSHAPFDSAFAAAHGAEVRATVSAATPHSTLVSTATAPGVLAAAGPFDQVIANISNANHLQLGSATIAGRSVEGGPVDRLSLDTGGWLTGPGEIVLSRDFAGPLADRVGDNIIVNLPGSPSLRLVGIADSVTGTADAWVWPSQADVLHATGAPAAEQMLYRFSSHSSDADLRTALTKATAALPAGAVVGVSTYLTTRQEANRSISAFVPFVVAFAILGIVMSVLISTNVVNGAVVSGYRTIGVLKTLGFTPRQVVTVYVIQVLVPSIIGCAAGVGLGVALATPLLAQTDRAYDLPGAVGGVPIWIMVTVFIGAPILVALAALGPAIRAGRLAANQAISVGRAPRAGRGYRLRRLLTATRLPRSVAFGLGLPLARPARAVGTVVAIMLGAVTLVFAVGLSASLGRIHNGFSRIQSVPVVVHLMGGDPANAGPVMSQKPGTAPPGPTITSAEAETVIAAQSGTAHTAEVRYVQIHIAGVNEQVTVEAYSGDASWVGFPMISGHWYAGADQVVASSYLLRLTGHHVGDRLTLIGEGGQRTVTVTGDFLDGGDDLDLVAGASTLSGVSATTEPPDIEIGLASGTNTSKYASSLQSGFPSNAGVFVEDKTQNNSERTFVILNALIATLTLLLCGVAALGVLNTVVLNTRERVHEIGVLKSLGMTPSQIRTMVITSMIGLGLFAGVIAVPCGVALQHLILPAMGNAAGTALPRSIVDVYGTAQLVLLGAIGIVIAVAGALLPATWAAQTRAANALRAE
jgi:putative ABC transport system permease protein